MNGQDQIELNSILYNVFGKSFRDLPRGRSILAQEIALLADTAAEASGGRPDWLQTAMDLRTRIGGEDKLENFVSTLFERGA